MGDRKRETFGPVGIVVLLILLCIYPVVRSFGWLTKAGRVHLATKTLSCPDRERAGQVAAHLEGSAFPRTIADAIHRKLGPPAWTKDDFSIEASIDDSTVHLNFSYTAWQRSRFDFRRWRPVMELDAEARRRNDAIEAVLDEVLAAIPKSVDPASMPAAGRSAIRDSGGGSFYYARTSVTVRDSRSFEPGEVTRAPAVLHLLLLLGAAFILAPSAMRSFKWSWYGAWGWKPDKESLFQSLKLYQLGGLVVICFWEFFVFTGLE